MISEVEHVGRNWWLFVVLGVICLVVGFLTIIWPGITLLTLGILAGIYLLVAAIMEIIDAIFGEPGGRSLSAILGIVSLIAGLIFIRRPGESLLALTMVAGIFLIAEGVIRVVRAFSGPGTNWWGVIVGLIDAIVGIIVLSWPKIGLVTLAVFFAVTMVVRGALAIVLGLKLRGLSKAVDESASRLSAA
ncbi:MAG TPA: DUF308 domain-containing protein [Solirubrobacter sp.]|nr:DUF308 domain-containing protein [Solirubrobacter sp.]